MSRAMIVQLEIRTAIALSDSPEWSDEEQLRALAAQIAAQARETFPTVGDVRVKLTPGDVPALDER